MLKKCPFCAAESNMVKWKSRYWVECPSCLTTGRQFDSATKASSFWNERPGGDDGALKEEVASLKAVVCCLAGQIARL